jgi:hypothetical protein
MEWNTFQLPNDSSKGNNIRIDAERAETSGSNPKRDTTLKCKGQTKGGKQCEQYVGELGQNGYCHFHLHLSNSNSSLQDESTTPNPATSNSATPKPTANINPLPINAEPTPPPSGKKEKRDTTLKCKGQNQGGKKCEQYVGMSGRNGYCYFHLYQENSDYAPEGFNSREGKEKEVATEAQQTSVVRNYLNHQLLGQEISDPQLLGPQLLDQHPLGQYPLDEQLSNDQSPNQEILSEELLMQHPLNHQRINPNRPVSFWNLYRGPPTGPVMIDEHLNQVRRPVGLSALANRRRANNQVTTILDNGNDNANVNLQGMNSNSTDPVLYDPAPAEKVYCPHCLGRRYANEEELWGYADGFSCPVTRDSEFTECLEVRGANRRL